MAIFLIKNFEKIYIRIVGRNQAARLENKKLTHATQVCLKSILEMHLPENISESHSVATRN